MRLDYVQVLRDLGIKVIRQQQDELICLCPFHDDSKPSFGFNTKSIVWNCWSCAAGGGGLLQLVAELKKISYRNAAKYIVDRYGKQALNRPLDDPKTVWDRLRGLPRGEGVDFFRTLPERQLLDLSLLGAYRHRWILPWRGISAKTLNEFRIGKDKLGRVYFPVFDRRPDQLVLIVRRNKVDPKYQVLHGVRKTGSFYGLHKLDTSTKEVLLVEGPVDYLRLWEYGVRNHLAILGSKLSRQQAVILHAVADRVILWLDNDEAGNDGMYRAAEVLQPHLLLSYVPYPEGKGDPAECSRKEVRRALKNRRPLAMEAWGTESTNDG